ncbi:hypothetical protein [Staphylococcus petrasii]|uniref:hypothetical protein n=1 Tax=Staphylococcus petrasii TaxID=1276936 RepID=UPI003F67FF05
MVSIIDLDKGDEVWFVPPNRKMATIGEVVDLSWNFKGEKESATVLVGTDKIKVEIDDTYKIAIGRKYNAKD